MRIIVESGATKSDWRVIGKDGKVEASMQRPGMSLSAMSPEAVRDELAAAWCELAASVDGYDIDSFELYLAGIVTDGARAALADAIASLTSACDIDIQDDMMAAARALFGRRPGIAAILGTGSNVCFYDGSRVHREVYAGGFILGDEGSAAVLGRNFISDLIKGRVPVEIAAELAASQDVSYPEIVRRVYRDSAPSAYLGSFAPFILSHIDHPYVKTLVEANFNAFLERSVSHYDTASYPLGIVGSFGHACRDIITPLAQAKGITISKFLKSPIDGLVLNDTLYEDQR